MFTCHFYCCLMKHCSSTECLSKLIACNPEVLLMLKLYRASKNNEEFPAVLQSLFYTCIEIALALKSNFCDKTEVNKWATKIKSILNCKIYWTKNETDIINMFYGYLCQTKKNANWIDVCVCKTHITCIKNWIRWNLLNNVYWCCIDFKLKGSLL